MVAQVQGQGVGLGNEFVVHVVDFGHDAAVLGLVVVACAVVASGMGGGGGQSCEGQGGEKLAGGFHESPFKG